MSASKTVGDSSQIGGVLARVASTRLLTLASGAIATLAATHSINARAGAEVFGRVTIVSTLILLVPFADLGLGAAVTNAYALTDKSKREKVLGHAIRLLAGVTAGIILIAFFLHLSGAWNRVLGVSEVDLPGFSAATALTLSIFALSLVPALSQRILLGIGKNQLLVLIQGLNPITSSVFVIFTTTFQLPYYYYCLGPAVGALATSAVCLFVCLKRGYLSCSAMREAFSRGASRVPSIFTEASSMFVIGVSLAVALQTDRLILAHTGTSADLAQYALVAQLFAPLWSVLASTAMTMWPRFAQIRAAQGAWRAYRQLMTFAIASSLLLSIAFALTSGPAARILSAGTANIPFSVSIAFSILLVVQVAHLPAGMFLTRPDELRYQAICCVLMASASIGVSIILAPSLGAAGPVVGSSIAVFIFQLLPCYLRVKRRAKP